MVSAVLSSGMAILVLAIAYPIVFPDYTGGQLKRLMEAAGQLLFWLVAVPAFIIGYRAQKRRRASVSPPDQLSSGAHTPNQ